MDASEFDSHIRPINVRRDLPEIADLIEDAFADQMDAEGRDYLHHIRAIARGFGSYIMDGSTPETSPLPFQGYLWEENGQIIGNLTLIPVRRKDRYSYFIANVAVRHDFRGRGIARKLTDRAIQHVMDHHGRQIFLQVRDDNPPAIHIYQQTGFTEIVRRTTWQCPARKALRQPLPQSSQVTRRKKPDWTQQKVWLDEIYPPEITWNLPYSLNRLKPGFWDSLDNFLNAVTVRTWAARQHGRLIGTASLENGFSGSNYLWLATSPVWETDAITTLVPHVVRKVWKPQKIMINYPAGRGSQAFTEMGMTRVHTLIWMKKDINQSIQN